MKIIALIMAFLVLALSVMPCADTNAMGANAITKISKQSQPQEDNHTDACSPFCTCTCCAGIAFLSALKKPALVSAPNSPVYSSIITPRLFSIALPVWQPPKLV